MKHTLKDFIPLISIFLIIIVLTLFSVTRDAESYFVDGMRLFMGYFFLVFGLFKIIKWKGFVMAYQKYDLLAKRSTLYAYLYPLIELGLGAAYLSSWNLFYINIFTVIIMLISVSGVWIKLREKEEIPCACLGVVFKLPMTKVTLVEDLLMMIMALGMLLF